MTDTSGSAAAPTARQEAARRAEQREESPAGRVSAVFLKEGHGVPMTPATEVVAESGKGLVGDVSHGQSKRQVLLVEAETVEEFGLRPGDVKENLTIHGLPLAGTPPGRRLAVGDAVLEVTMDCAPCGFMDDLRPGLRDASVGRRGTLCRVVAGGRIAAGDPVRWLGDRPRADERDTRGV